MVKFMLQLGTLAIGCCTACDHVHHVRGAVLRNYQQSRSFFAGKLL